MDCKVGVIYWDLFLALPSSKGQDGTTGVGKEPNVFT